MTRGRQALNNARRRGTIRIGVICGGQSAEHDISLRSARAVAAALDGTHEVVLIYIQPDGTWRLADAPQFIAHATATRDAPPRLSGGPLTLSGGDAPVPPPPALDHAAARLVDLVGGTPSLPLDVVFPVLHGPFGEDGTVQGLLELAGVPYVGAGVLGSAVAMDKEVSKRLLRDAGIASARFRAPARSAAGGGRGADLRRPGPAAVRQAGQPRLVGGA